MLKMFLLSLDNIALNKESELVSSLEILTNLEVGILQKHNSELDWIWEELYLVEMNSELLLNISKLLKKVHISAGENLVIQLTKFLPRKVLKNLLILF